jgi:Spy/CpxP family protein refolding chaperone
MIRISIAKQIAVAAGFLALTFAPGISRAQDSVQAPAQDQSQTATAAPAKHEGRMHGAMKGLNLTDDQKAEMKKIHESTKSQVDALKQDGSLTADQKEAKIHEMRRTPHAMVKLDAGTAEQMRANVCFARVASRTTETRTATNPAAG